MQLIANLLWNIAKESNDAEFVGWLPAHEFKRVSQDSSKPCCACTTDVPSRPMAFTVESFNGLKLH